MSLNRGLNRGLKYDDDDGPSDPQQYGKTGLIIFNKKDFKPIDNEQLSNKM
jgi:hypothetical protein